jgi:hypothetical protein
MVAVVSFTAMLLIDIFSLNISSLVLLLSAVALGLTVYLIRKKTEGGKAQ